MRGIAPILKMWKLAYYRWARHDMTLKGGMHPDLPLVVLRIAELEKA